jgi:hypothetical protein
LQSKQLTQDRNCPPLTPAQQYRITIANMADKPPPAKRVRYIYLRTHQPIASITNRSRLNFDETFEVLTGEKPNQKCFTVHRQPFIERSKFLEAASSSRWTSGTRKPVDLTEHEPEVFASYMQCVYHGSVAVPKLPVYEEGKSLGGLIKLYLLADKLNDILTSNLVMDEIIHLSEEWRRIPCDDEVALAYRLTTTGNPLRSICRDYFVHEGTARLLETLEEGTLPFQFIKDVLLEFERLASSKAPYDKSNKVQCVNREKCHYHQHDDEHPKCA